MAATPAVLDDVAALRDEQWQIVAVQVGRADQAAGTEGLTLHDVVPEIPGAIRRSDPVATGQALD